MFTKFSFMHLILLLLLFFGPLQLFAASDFSEADKLYNAGGIENLKKAASQYEKIASADPNSFEANWKIAMACREYAEQCKRQNIPDWEEICKNYGKKGIQYAEIAIKLDPSKIYGHYYYGACAGSYADGISIIKALSEGLKDKTQNSFETSYQIDKRYRDGLPVVALGRFWQVLPWPLHDKKKALNLYREAEKIMPAGSKYRPELNFYLGELLEDMGNDAEARSILEIAATSDDSYFKEKAKQLLSEMK